MTTQPCFHQFLYHPVAELCMLPFQFSVGSSGAVSSIIGSGITTIAKLGTGVYRIKLDKKYNRFIELKASIIAPDTGSPVAAGSLNPTTVYRITTIGTSDFTLVGAAVNAVGEPFIASATTAGTGTATAVAAGQVLSFQPISGIITKTQYISFQCVDDTGAVINPEDTCKITGFILLRDSAVKQKGE